MLKSAGLVTVFLMAAAGLARAQDYDPGFGVHDPNRKCYQAWCYMGSAQNTVGSIVEPDPYRGGTGLGAFVGTSSIQFMEMPFPAGSYRVRLTIAANRDGSSRSRTAFEGPATMRDAVLTVPSDRETLDGLRRGRYLKVQIRHNSALYTSATFPLYGFTKASRHMR